MPHFDLLHRLEMAIGQADGRIRRPVGSLYPFICTDRILMSFCSRFEHTLLKPNRIFTLPYLRPRVCQIFGEHSLIVTIAAMGSDCLAKSA